MTGAAIVVQNFNKPDTLEAVCKSLLACDNARDFDVIFWSDTAAGSRKEAEYLPKCAEVERLLNSFSQNHSEHFRSIALRRNPFNLGCYETCRIALDNAFDQHDFVIFAEDDAIFSPDALNWFASMRNSPAFLDDAVWAIAGESIFFDAQRAVPSEELVAAAKIHAVEHRLWEKYIPLDFIPSTCFATNRQKWAQFCVTRGHTNGDVELCHRCQAEQKKCLFPIVARVKDVGMLHPDGYSVSVHTAENVTGVKNCYLVSGDIRPDSNSIPELRPFDGDAGLLFWRSTQLNGFGEKPGNRQARQAISVPEQSILLRDARKAGLDGNWDVALGLWHELKRLGVATPEVQTNIGLCFLKLGEHDRARSAIQRVLNSYPDDSYAQSIMAYILEADGDFAAALKVWEHIHQTPGLPEWLTTSAINGDRRCKAAGAPAAL